MRAESSEQANAWPGDPLDPVDPSVVAGRYRLLRRLGQGSSGVVFVARDESTGQQLALKRQLQEAGSKRSSVSLMREYHALSGLVHPKIVEVYDYGVDGATPFYTMEYLDGRDFSEIAPLPYREACGYLRDVASALALLHDRRLLHRDVSPRNVRLASDGRCKLIDFGAMVPFGMPPNIVGTPTCIAPEALQGGSLAQTSDLYSLGTVAYFVLTGRHAFPARELSALPPLWQQRVPALLGSTEIPKALVELVMSLLSLDPMQRPSSAAEVIERLSAIAELPEDNLAFGRSYLASTPLLGRARERSVLAQALGNTKNGKGSTIWVIGEEGFGKTRMLAEASLLGQTSGLLVVRATLREQRGLSSSLVHDLVMGLMKVAPREALKAMGERPLIRAIVHDEPVHSESAELLQQAEAFVCEIAQKAPLLLTFDDAHNGSDLDNALIAALAHRTQSCPLCVVGSERNQKRLAWLARISNLARPLPLRELDRGQVSLLSAALFGNVPNVAQISDFFFRNAQGNPKMTLGLADHLLDRGTVRYVAGGWVLPDQIHDTVPRDMAQTLMLRLREVSADARRLLEILCVRRRGARAEQLLALAAPLPTEQVLRALEELVREGALESAGYEYAFVMEALRVELNRSLTPERSHALHKLWAEYLLANTPSQDERLEAGWHLSHTAEDLRGAELLVEVAPKLFEQRTHMAAAIPAVERALEVYERHGKSLSTRLRLRAFLTLSSYLYDYRLAARYAISTLDQLYPFTGLPQAERSARFVGKRFGFVLGVTWAMVRWLLHPAATRGPNVLAALKYYAMSAMGLMGLRALAVDNTEVVLERMRGFRDVPHSGLAFTYEVANAIHLHGMGQPAEARHAIERAWSKLEGKRPWQVTTHEELDLTVGLLLVQGFNECWRERSRALACADKLDEIGSHLAIAASLRIRMVYYLVRGDAARAHNYRRMLELKAVETGSLWQVQWMAVPLEGLSAATWHDVVGMRRSLERYDQLVLEAPALSRLRDTILVPYYVTRGELEKAAATGDNYLCQFPPKTCIGWQSVYAMTALAHAHLGRAERALEICERALAHISVEDREYFVFQGALDAAYATALALTGQADKSAQVFREGVERMRSAGEHLRALVLHHHRIRLARLMGDRTLLQAALADMQKDARDSRNPAAQALAQRLSDERSEQQFEVDPWSDIANDESHPPQMGEGVSPEEPTG